MVHYRLPEGSLDATAIRLVGSTLAIWQAVVNSDDSIAQPLAVSCRRMLRNRGGCFGCGVMGGQLS